ncbi:cytochrome P450 [Streptomyces sp. NRRL S-340]|uniref:cytochrome P450 n=1 Tax=Streptomyces sp. NRRL S-340 TaxID=1463901 RepID=UPI00055DD313|nr:cytochrome P450 [Streptomyces sp. NRRL S-340]
MIISKPPFCPVQFQDSDLLDSGFHAATDMHALWADLRDNQPLYRADPGGGREPFWVVTRHEDVSRVLRSYGEFSSRRGTILCVLDLNTADIASDNMMADTDPPRHREFREPLNKAFSPSVVATQERLLRELSRDLIQSVLEAGVYDIAHKTMMFPMAVTGTLMGLPPESWERLAELVMMTIAYDDPDYSAGSAQATVRQARHELFEYFQKEYAQRSRDDVDPDVIGAMVGMDLSEGPMSQEQVLLNAFVLLIGANVTTPHALCTLMSVMAEHPDQFRAVQENPELRTSCLQELLRWSSPVTALMRYAVKDVEMHGRTIRAGEPVTAWIGAANRDERVFPDPYTFDVARRPNKHLAFGLGPHYCIGANLAKVGLDIFLDELLERVESIEIAGEVKHVASHFVPGYKSMPVRFTPRRAHVR